MGPVTTETSNRWLTPDGLVQILSRCSRSRSVPQLRVQLSDALQEQLGVSRATWADQRAVEPLAERNSSGTAGLAEQYNSFGWSQHSPFRKRIGQHLLQANAAITLRDVTRNPDLSGDQSMNHYLREFLSPWAVPEMYVLRMEMRQDNASLISVIFDQPFGSQFHDYAHRQQEELFRVLARYLSTLAHSLPLEHPRELSLSPRLSEIVGRIADGSSNADIARKMFITEDTVKKYVQRVFRLSEVKSRAELVSLVTSGALLIRSTAEPERTDSAVDPLVSS